MVQPSRSSSRISHSFTGQPPNITALFKGALSAALTRHHLAVTRKVRQEEAALGASRAPDLRPQQKREKNVRLRPKEAES